MFFDKKLWALATMHFFLYYFSQNFLLLFEKKADKNENFSYPLVQRHKKFFKKRDGAAQKTQEHLMGTNKNDDLSPPFPNEKNQNLVPDEQKIRLF